MSERMLIFDAMIEMFESAMRAGRKPRRWEINEAGICALKMDPRTWHMLEKGKPFIEYPFCGTPLSWMPDPERRYSADPKVDLIVDEKTAASYAPTADRGDPCWNSNRSNVGTEQQNL